jgi:hypothetical protein
MKTRELHDGWTVEALDGPVPFDVRSRGAFPAAVPGDYSMTLISDLRKSSRSGWAAQVGDTNPRSNGDRTGFHGTICDSLDSTRWQPFT